MDELNADIVVNVQAMSPKLIPIVTVIEAMTDPDAKCSTLACPWILTRQPERRQGCIACNGTAVFQPIVDSF